MTHALAQADITAGLRQLGLQAGDGVMVHSSLKSFGRVEGGPQTVIAALMEVLTPEGTLLLPSFNHGAAFDPRPGPPPNENHIWGREQPLPHPCSSDGGGREGVGMGYYAPTETPTTNGAIPDCFWRLEGVRRSLDPTHAFAAWGKHARRYTEFHHRTLTMGPQSPLGLLCGDSGYTLLLGVDYGANTFHHVVEMSTNAPCLGQRSEDYPVKLPDGRMVQGRTWGWRDGECPITDHTAYAEEMRPYERVALIGPCHATLFKLQDAYQVIARLLTEGKGNLPPCTRCPIRPRRNRFTVPSDWDAGQQCLMPDSAAWNY
jgi:aminoglycoside N3'-acetyltransferase